MNIIEIAKIKNVRIKNKHNDFIFPTQDILRVSFENGDIRTIDLICEKDITDIDYFEVIESDRTKERILFKDSYVRGL